MVPFFILTIQTQMALRVNSLFDLGQYLKLRSLSENIGPKENLPNGNGPNSPKIPIRCPKTLISLIKQIPIETLQSSPQLPVAVTFTFAGMNFSFKRNCLQCENSISIYF